MEISTGLSTGKITLLELTYRFNTIPVRIPANFFVEIDKSILKCIYNCKGPKIPKQSYKEQNWRM